MSQPGISWYAGFRAVLRDHPKGPTLRDAANARRLAEWTAALTAVVVESCHARGWQPAAKGHVGRALPRPQQEYLGIDVSAFPASETSDWRHPVAVFELENDDKKVEYSLWKVMCVIAPLRVVFAYRDDWEQGAELVRTLTQRVIRSFGDGALGRIGGETLLIIGTRGDAATFPDGFFKPWLLNVNTGVFDRMG